MAVSPSDSLQTSRTSDRIERPTAKESGAAPAKWKERSAPCRVWSRGAENNPAAAVQASMDACMLYSSQDTFGRVKSATVFRTTGCRLNI